MKKTLWITLLIILVACVFATIACDAVVRFSAKGAIYDQVDIIPHNKVGLLLGTAPFTPTGQHNYYFDYRIDAASSLFYADKVEYVERLLSEKSYGKTLAFVGDGINDAPVLARADVGIAMGALGSDAAIEAADVVLMDDQPSKLPAAVAIARRTISIARQNVCLAIGVKVAVLVLATVGVATMWMAVFADVGVTVLAVLNAMRALRT